MARPIDLLDVLLALSERAAVASDRDRAVLLAEAEVRLANAGNDAELVDLRVEFQRLAGSP